jgi:dihydroxyacetone kinase-like predicted kinase
MHINNKEFVSGYRLKASLLEGVSWFKYLSQDLQTKPLDGIHSTLVAVADSLKASRVCSVSMVMQHASSAALNAAKESSGESLANFLHGFYLASRDKERLSSQELALCFNNAAEYLCKRDDLLDNEIMRNVVVNLARIGLEASRQDICLIDTLRNIYDCAADCLASSTEEKPEKSELESGWIKAKGLVNFLEGVVRYNTGLSKKNIYREKLVSVLTPFGKISSDFCFRVEFVLKANTFDFGYLKTLLTSFSDSVIIERDYNNQKDMIRVSLRTQLPELVFDGVADLGKLLSVRVDDLATNTEKNNSSG